MGIRLPEVMLHAKQVIRSRLHSKHRCSYQTSTHDMVDVPQGHFPVYVGDSIVLDMMK
ncbi:indole-3-acetic acid-induced protein ARG7-like [Hibiscus syriacus]|uniref:Indole-3-acetic acid-induced protein ARG7-like n=1 Tax=Hibiscus syriacus TaxID=106335 RepID=A0A6A3D8N1_HIBSY|nr:indole-3-acetic acid-induced protein ARG7-like [Hibiscus syriacus]